MFDLDIVDKARIILGVKKISKGGITRPADLMLTSITSQIILLLSFLITANKMMKSPVGCMNMPMTSRWAEYVESQCWVKGPYYVDADTEITDEVDESRRLSYYAYLPYIFGFSALITYIPYFLFSMCMKSFSLKYEAIYSGCEMLASIEERKSSSRIADRIYFYLKNFELDRYYITLFLLARVCYIVGILMVPVFYSMAFNMNFLRIGFKAAFFFVGDNSKVVATKFPINGLCHVSIREQVQGDQRNYYNIQCNLATNLLVSKIIGFIFVLIFFIILPLGITDTIYTFNHFLCKRKGYNSKELVLFLIKDSVSPSAYSKISETYTQRVLNEHYIQMSKANIVKSNQNGQQNEKEE